jgi:hypothetical protein
MRWSFIFRKRLWTRPGIADIPKERNRIAVTTPLHSRIGLEGNELLLDAFVPFGLAYALDGESESRIDSSIPIQAAFSRQLIGTSGKFRVALE